MATQAKSAQKPKGQKKPAQHPPYGEMIKAAINALKDRKGASKQAIVKYVKANYKVGDNCNTQVKMQLVRMVKSEQLTQATGTGANGRFKINKVTEDAKAKKAAAQAKKKAAAATKKTAAKPKKASSPKKKTGAKKTTVKKQTKKPAAKKSAAKKQATKKPAPKKSPKKKPAVKKTAAKKPASKKSPKKTAKKSTKK